MGVTKARKKLSRGSASLALKPKGYLSRAQAHRRLQCSMKTFKRMCIIKGIYPRIPNKRLTEKEKNFVYYLKKDVDWANNDAALAKFRQYEIYRKRMVKLVHRKDWFEAKKKLKSKPQIRYAPIIKERYPSFIDALKDLDDALCHIYLYATVMPFQVGDTNIIEGARLLTTGLSQKCQSLVRRFNEYVAKTNSLRKTFISVKGYYYEAEIKGIKVVWNVPHCFPIDIPQTIDHNVMMDFLEFYTVFLDFVLFRLENDLKRLKKAKDEKEKDDENAQLTEDFPLDKEQERKESDATACASLFKGLSFFMSREIPVAQVGFVIRAFGGTVTDDEDQRKLPTITHEIVDRPPHLIKDKILERDYVQPQWVFDCANFRYLLPVEQYAPGVALPPHLSPFRSTADRDRTGTPYVTEREKEIEAMKNPVPIDTDTDEAEESEADTTDEEITEQRLRERFGMDSIPHKTDGVVESDSEGEDSLDEDGNPKKRARKPKADSDDDVPLKPAAASTFVSGKERLVQTRVKGAIQTVPAWKLKTTKQLPEKELARRAKQEKDQQDEMKAAMMDGRMRQKWRKTKHVLDKKDERVMRLKQRQELIERGAIEVLPGGVLHSKRKGNGPKPHHSPYEAKKQATRTRLLERQERGGMPYISGLVPKGGGFRGVAPAKGMQVVQMAIQEKHNPRKFQRQQQQPQRGGKRQGNARRGGKR